jgi:hypothetical protein
LAIQFVGEIFQGRIEGWMVALLLASFKLSQQPLRFLPGGFAREVHINIDVR